jgi:hypothetical protein
MKTQVKMWQWAKWALAILFLMGSPGLRAQDFGQESYPRPGAEVVRANRELLEYIFDVKFTPAQAQELERRIHRFWDTNQATKMAETYQDAALWQKMLQMSPAERDLFKRCHLVSILVGQTKVAAQDPNSVQAWLLGIYYAAHPPVVQGYPALSREMVVQALEAERFFAEIKGEKVKPVAQVDAKVLAEAASHWQKIGREGQMQAADGVGRTMQLKYRWASLPPIERTMIKASLVGEQQLTVAERLEIQQFNAQVGQMMRSHQVKILSNELNHMAENQRIIFGYERWNVHQNRWERVGGINTEFK